MLVQIQNGSNFVGLACIGSFLLASYSLFAFYVTRHGDFYMIRRWRAAIWTSLFSTILFLVIFNICVVGVIGINSPILKYPNLLSGTLVKNIFLILKFSLDLLIVFLPCLTIFLFIITIGTYYRLKWWLNSDDFLDKLWKDPNKNRKSPIQWL